MKNEVVGRRINPPVGETEPDVQQKITSQVAELLSSSSKEITGQVVSSAGIDFSSSDVKSEVMTTAAVVASSFAEQVLSSSRFGVSALRSPDQTLVASTSQALTASPSGSSASASPITPAEISATASQILTDHRVSSALKEFIGSASSSVSPTVSSTVSSSVSPTVSPTVSSSASPTVSSTVSPTQTASDSLTVSSSASPTPTASASQTFAQTTAFQNFITSVAESFGLTSTASETLRGFITSSVAAAIATSSSPNYNPVAGALPQSSANNTTTPMPAVGGGNDAAMIGGIVGAAGLVVLATTAVVLLQKYGIYDFVGSAANSSRAATRDDARGASLVFTSGRSFGNREEVADIEKGPDDAPSGSPVTGGASVAGRGTGRGR